MNKIYYYIKILISNLCLGTVTIRIEPLKVKHDTTKLNFTIPLLSLLHIDINNY